MAETETHTDLFAFIKSLTFVKFAIVFGTMWTAGRDGVGGRYDRWNFWRGVSRPTTSIDGPYPGSVVRAGVEYFMGQLDMLRTFGEAVITWLSKARQMGGSEGAALYAIFVCMTEAKSLVMVFSKDGPAAKAFLSDRVARKLEGMLVLDRGDGQVWPWADGSGKLPWEIFENRIEFWNGSVIEAHSSDDSGAVSRTPRLVIFDEIRFYARKNAKEMWTSMLGALNPPMQIIAISTAQPGSWYNEKTDEIMAGKIPTAKFVFLPDDTNPAHTVQFRANRLAELGGDVALLSRDCPLVPSDMFIAHEGLVLGSFGDRHQVVLPFAWQPQEEFIIVYDYGSTEGHPAVALFCKYNPYRDHFHIFDEVFVRGKDLAPYFKENFMPRLREWQARALAMGQKMPPPYCLGDVRGKVGTRTIADVIREETGLVFNAAYKYDKAASLELLKVRIFRQDRFTIDPKMCPQTIKQMKNLRYKEGKDEPDEKEDDAIDCERYAAYYLHEREPVAEPTYEEKQLERVREWKRQAAGSTPEAARGPDINKSWLTVG